MVSAVERRRNRGAQLNLEKSDKIIEVLTYQSSRANSGREETNKRRKDKIFRDYRS